MTDQTVYVVISYPDAEAMDSARVASVRVTTSAPTADPPLGNVYQVTLDDATVTTGPNRMPAPVFCEHRPYPGSFYHCLLDKAEHERQEAAGAHIIHSDLTICWLDDGALCNGDGSVI